MRQPARRRCRSLGFALTLALCCIAFGSALAEDDGRKYYERAQRLIAGGESEEALGRLQTITKRFPQTEWSALALWDIYRIFEHLGDPEAAFAALDALIAAQPGHFAKAHEAQLLMVQRLLGAGKDQRRSLERREPVAKLDPEILAAMLRRIIRNGPESEVGIQANYYLAVALERVGETDASIQAHEDFAEAHPQHELADDAGYQAAYIAYKRWKLMRSTGPKQREHAAVALAWFMARFPQSDKVAQARTCLSDVRQAELRELQTLARYYTGRDNPEAARIYYAQLIDKFPDAIASNARLRAEIEAAVGALRITPAADTPPQGPPTVDPAFPAGQPPAPTPPQE